LEPFYGNCYYSGWLLSFVSEGWFGLAKVDVLKAFSRLLHPKPVLLVTSVDGEGRPNIITVAWATPASVDPPVVAICVKKDRYSHKLISETGEFVINIPTRGLVDKAMYCGTVSGADVDKFRETGLTAAPARAVRPPIIEECVAHIECRVEKSVDAGSHTIFLGRVLAAYADEERFQNRMWLVPEADLVLHMGGRSYATLAEKFTL